MPKTKVQQPKKQQPRLQVLFTNEDEVRIAHRNAAIYAVSQGIDPSTTTAVRHWLLNMPVMGMLEPQKGVSV